MKTISLPAGPFFCAQDGRYLPGLTGLIIEAAAMLQRAEIEEQLLKLRLKRGCFRALAMHSPQSLVLSPQSEDGAARQQRPTVSSIKIFPGSLAEQFKTT